MPEQIVSLKGFIEKGRADQAGAQGHQMKGAAANIGSNRFQQIAHAVKKAGKAGDIKKLKNLMPQVEKVYSQLKHAMGMKD